VRQVFSEDEEQTVKMLVVLWNAVLIKQQKRTSGEIN